MISDDRVRGGWFMQQIIFAMFAAGLFLAAQNMAKIFFHDKETSFSGLMPQDRLLWMRLRRPAEKHGIISQISQIWTVLRN